MQVRTSVPLPAAARLAVQEGVALPPAGGIARSLSGSSDDLRHTQRNEADPLAARQRGLARPDSRRATLIPIRQSAA
jgi:hypothetical protein